MTITTFANITGQPLLPSEALGAIVTAALVVSRGDPAEAAEYAARTMAAQMLAYSKRSYGGLSFTLEQDVTGLTLAPLDGALPPPANDDAVPDFSAARAHLRSGQASAAE